MLLIAVQPMLAMHFCDGEFYSLNLLEDKTADECCIEASKHVEMDACCTETEAQNHSNHDCVEHEADNCCDTQTIQIETDEFQSEIKTVSLNQSAPAFEIPWLIFSNIFKQIEPEKNPTFLSDTFPAEGLFLKDVNINTFVCTYRI